MREGCEDETETVNKGGRETDREERRASAPGRSRRLVERKEPALHDGYGETKVDRLSVVLAAVVLVVESIGMMSWMSLMRSSCECREERERVSLDLEREGERDRGGRTLLKWSIGHCLDNYVLWSGKKRCQGRVEK